MLSAEILVSELHVTNFVQKLFSLNKGTKEVSISLNNEVVAGQDSLYATAAIDEKTNDLIIKLVNASDKEQMSSISIEVIKSLATKGVLTVLKSDSLYSVNSFSILSIKF